MHEVQINTGNSDIVADWHTVGNFQGQKTELTGLTPGTRIESRARNVVAVTQYGRLREF